MGEADKNLIPQQPRHQGWILSREPSKRVRSRKFRPAFETWKQKKQKQTNPHSHKRIDPKLSQKTKDKQSVCQQSMVSLTFVDNKREEKKKRSSRVFPHSALCVPSLSSMVLSLAQLSEVMRILSVGGQPGQQHEQTDRISPLAGPGVAVLSLPSAFETPPAR